MSNFAMTIGLPGSGKSTFSRSMTSAGWVVHSSDSIRDELGLDPTKKEDNKVCFSTMKERTLSSLANNQDVIYDATNLTRKNRMALLKEVAPHAMMTTCVLFITPIDECKRRDSERDRHVGDEVIDRMVGQFQLPWVYEGWGSIGVFPNSYASTYVYPTENMDQKNPHHKLGLLDHMIGAEKYAVDNEFSDAVILAARYHDLGKYITQTLDDDGVAHYYNHHNAGAYMFLSGYTNPTDFDLYVANLINWHMAPYMEWKKSEHEMKDREMMGLQMYLDIMNLHKADEAAH